MQKRRGLIQGAVLLVAVLSAAVLQAAPWAVVVDSPSNRICTVDFGTPTPTVHGPFLYRQLGSVGGEIYDVAITPDGNTALISNFGDLTVYRVDVSDPERPIVTGHVTNNFFAEDIAITPNGQYALVTDGGFSPKLDVIDLATFSNAVCYAITSGCANAVAVAPDNQTVIMADYFAGKIVFGTLCPTGLVAESFLPTASSQGAGLINRPVNVAISPDGQTVVTANAGTNEFNIYRIVSPGVVVTGATPVVRCSTNVPHAFSSQSIAFSPSGDRIYVLQNGMNTNISELHGFNYLTWLQVNGPGDVSMGGESVALLAAEGTSQLFGVDTLTVSPDGAWALAGNPTLSAGTNMLSLVNLSDFTVTKLDAGLTIPVGVEFIRTPDVDHTFSVSPDLPVPRVGQTITGRIAVTNSGYATLDPICVELTYDPDYLGHSTGGVAAAGVVAWTNVGPLVSGEAVELTVEFVALKGTLPGSTFPTTLVDAQAVGGYQLSNQTAQALVTLANVVHPVWGDYDGDGISDPALYVESTGDWYVRVSGSGYAKLTGAFGGPGSVPVKGDYDGDGKADPAIFTPATGTWRAMLSGSGYNVASLTGFGATGLYAVPGDFDGDGKSDLTLNELATGNWHAKLSASGYAGGTMTGFGGPGYHPLAGRFDADLKYDPAIYDAVTGEWRARLSASGYGVVALAGFGGVGYRPVIGDFDGDGLEDPAIYRDTTASWRIRKSRSGYAETAISDFGAILTRADAADYDNDGLDDPLYLDEVTGKWHVLLSSMGYIEEIMISSGYLE